MRRQAGFTLVELMVAVTILVILSGTVYTAFNSSLNVYQRESERIVTLQKCRAALDLMARDLSNFFYLPGDDDFGFMAEDVSLETGDQDVITFVTVTDPTPDPVLAQLTSQQEETQGTTETSLTGEETTTAHSDLVRVIYMLGPDPEYGDSTEPVEEGQPLALLRILSRTLNLEELMTNVGGDLTALVDAEQAALESWETPDTQTQVVIDHVASLDLKFFDGEEWIETWEDDENVPQAVQVILTVVGEEDPTRQVIQSTMSYFIMAVQAQQTQASTPSGGQEQTPSPGGGSSFGGGSSPGGGPGGGSR